MGARLISRADNLGTAVVHVLESAQPRFEYTCDATTVLLSDALPRELAPDAEECVGSCALVVVASLLVPQSSVGGARDGGGV